MRNDWQFYAVRAVGDLRLDGDVQLADVSLTWMLSGACTGTARVPSGAGYVGSAVDGRDTWGKWDTVLLAEEDNELTWAGICNSANPEPSGLQLGFTSAMGWLHGVEFSSNLKLWRTDVFDVVRMLTQHAHTKPNAFPFTTSRDSSAFYVGDLNPGAEPQPPVKQPGQSQADYEATPEYQQWLIDYDNWQQHKNNQYTLDWWEAPTIGDEIDSLASEIGFEYREEFSWRNRHNLEYEVRLQLADVFGNRRDDIEFVDGVNIADTALPKDDTVAYSNHIIALGAGEGKDMLRAMAGDNGNRLYQAQYRPYKSIRNQSRLKNLAEQDLHRFSNPQPRLDSVTVWDMPGFAPIQSLKVGNEVRVRSENTIPSFSLWCRIVSITRDPQSAVGVLRLEPAT